jgi:serine/threonine protein kinase
MTTNSGRDDPSLSPSVAEFVDQVCNTFEEAWKGAGDAGTRPRVENYVGGAPESARPALLRELLLLDIYYRRQDGEEPTPEEYRGRFPRDEELIRALFCKSLRAGAPQAGNTGPNRGPPTMTFQLTPGAEPVAGYRLVERLGGGGCGEVWRADSPGGGQVALKFVALNSAAADVEQRALECFTAVRHPNIVTVFGSWRLPGYLLVGMDLADGTLLDRLFAAQALGYRGIPFAELLEYVEQAARGLDHLNGARHVLPSAGGRPVSFQHRDVKPQNLLLVGGSVKVGDWGLMRVLEGVVTSHSGFMTPAYAAPEFFLGRTSSTSDQYSLAVTYYHLRTGQRLFGEDPRDGHLNRAPDLSQLPDPRERLVVERALAKNPQERWPSSHEFAAALREAACPPVTTVTGAGGGGASDRLAGGLCVPPFNFGSVVPPQHFINREQELVRAREWIEAGQSFLLIGAHRVGKTSFCKKLIHTLMGSPNNQVLAAYVNLQACIELTSETFLEHTLLGMVGEIARQVFRCKYTDLRRADPAASNPLLRGDALFEAFVHVAGLIHDRTHSRGGVAPRPLDFPEFVQFTQDLLHIIRLRGWSNFALLYDEANRLPRDLSVDLLVSNEEALNSAGVLCVYVASPEMVEVFGPLYETFGRELRLGPFPSIHDLRRLLACYCFNDQQRIEDIPVTVEALELLWGLTRGQPYPIQMLAGRGFDMAAAEQAEAVGADHVRRAHNALRGERPQLFVG